MNLYINRDVLFINGGRLSSINSSNRKQSLDSTQWIWQWWKWRWRTRWFLYRILHVCSTGIFFSNSVSSNKKYPKQISSFWQPSSKVHLWCMISLISHLIYLHFIRFPSNPNPRNPPKLPVVGATTCRRGLLWLREPLAIGDGTTTSGSPGSNDCQVMWRKWWHKNGNRKTSDTVIWGWFWDCWDDFGMLIWG